MSKPEISYIIGAFNRPGRLRTLLACLVDQSHTNWEAVVTDNSNRYWKRSKRAVRVYVKIDPRIQL